MQTYYRLLRTDRSIPLALPTTSARAILLLSRGKAKAHRNKLGIFCSILNREVEPDNQQIAFGIDPGSHYDNLFPQTFHTTFSQKVDQKLIPTPEVQFLPDFL